MPKTYSRSMRFDRSKMDAKARTIEISVSSDADSVQRYITGYGLVREILGHEKGEIDLYRFETDHGGPLLYNHDFSELIGRFTVSGVKGGKLRGVARLGNSPKAESLWRDIQDGILVDVSISYDYDPQNTEPTEFDSEGRALAVRVTSWTPLEVSFVTVPADASVGVGRSKAKSEEDDEDREEDEEEGREEEDEEDGEEDRATEPEEDDEDREEDEEDEEDEEKSAKKGKKAKSAKHYQPAAPRGVRKEPAMATERAAAQAADRVTRILALADQFGVSNEKRNEWISQGASVPQVRKEILDGFRASAKPLQSPSAALGLSEGERGRYSIARALRWLVTQDPKEGGFEREVSTAMAAKLGRQTGGLLIPSDMKMRGPLSLTHATATATMGAELVMPEYQGYLNLLKNAAVVLQMGARLVTGLQGTPTWVRQTGTSQIFWINENPPADAAESSLTWDIVTSSPKTAKSLLSYTRQQVLQSIEAFEPLVQQDLLENDALAVDTAALTGSGTEYQPLGLLNTPGIHTMNLGANGRKPTYADITRMKTLVKKANAIGLGTGGYLTTPDIQDLLENTPKLSNTIAQAVWENDSLAGYKALGANQVPSGLAKGSAANCHALIFGIWSELHILEWGALEMIVDPYTHAARDVVRVTTSHLIDVFVRRPQAFAAAKDALAD